MIKIYYANTTLLYEESVFEQLFDKVNVQRRSKILRCKNKEDKYRSLAAGLVLRYALEQEGICYETAVVETRENGKPYVKGREDFVFNISHSGDMVVCAVYVEEDMADTNDGISRGHIPAQKIGETDICQLGIDIESLERVAGIATEPVRSERFMKRIATESERSWFEELPEGKKTEGFLRLWTGKESYGKKNGKGISQQLQRIEVLREEDFLFLQVKEQYYLTVCMENINKRRCELFPINIAKEYLK